MLFALAITMPDRGLQPTTKILSQIVTHNNIVALQNFPFWSPALIFITLLVGGSVGGSIGGSIGGLHSAHRTTFASFVAGSYESKRTIERNCKSTDFRFIILSFNTNFNMLRCLIIDHRMCRPSRAERHPYIVVASAHWEASTSQAAGELVRVQFKKNESQMCPVIILKLFFDHFLATALQTNTKIVCLFGCCLARLRVRWSSVAYGQLRISGLFGRRGSW